MPSGGSWIPGVVPKLMGLSGTTELSLADGCPGRTLPADEFGRDGTMGAKGGLTGVPNGPVPGRGTGCQCVMG